MKRTILIGLLCAISARSAQVEHAPSVKQCRADQVVWRTTLEDPTLSAAETFATFFAWSKEMLDCAKVDSSPSRVFDYFKTASEASNAMGARETDFLMRHNLYDQFLEEDKQGKRGAH
jgi:hypothetical protein